MHVDDHHGGVAIRPRDGHQIDVVVFHECVGEAILLKDRTNTALVFVFQNLRHKYTKIAMRDVSSIVSIHEDFPLRVQNVQCTR